MSEPCCPLGPPLIIRLLVCFFPALPARVERAERLPRPPPRQLHQPDARPQVSAAAAAKPPLNIINLSSYLYTTWNINFFDENNETSYKQDPLLPFWNFHTWTYKKNYVDDIFSIHIVSLATNILLY